MISNAATKTAQRTLRTSLPCRKQVIAAALPFNQRNTPYSSSSGAMNTESPTDMRSEELRQPLKAAAFDGAAASPSPAGVACCSLHWTSMVHSIICSTEPQPCLLEHIVCIVVLMLMDQLEISLTLLLCQFACLSALLLANTACIKQALCY